LLFQYILIFLTVIWGIVLVPLYLKFIPLDVYGAWLATGNIVAWLAVIDPGLSEVLQQKVATAYGGRKFANIGSLIIGGGLITLVIAMFVLLVGWLISDILVNWIKLENSSKTKLVKDAFLLAVMASTISIFSYSVVAINKGLQGSLAIGIISVTVYVLSLLLVIFLLYTGFSLLAIPIALIFHRVGVTLSNLIYLGWRLWSEKISLSFSFRQILTLTGLLSYTFIGRAGVVVAENVDAFIVARFMGAEIVPVLELTRKVPQMSKLVVERPVVAFMPAISHLVGTNEIDKARIVLLRLIRLILWLLGLIIGGFIAFNDDFVKLWVGADLFAGSTINFIICVTIAMSALTSNLAQLCWALGNIKGNSLANLLQSGLQICLAIIGIYYFGLLGLVLAPLLAIFAVSAWYYPRSFSRLLSIPSADRHAILREIVKTLLIVIVLIGIFIFPEPEGWLTFTIWTLSFSLCYGIVLWSVSSKARLEIIGLLNKLKSVLGRFMPLPGKCS
jgi:O-antigen/teichoic acid export membrane protein